MQLESLPGEIRPIPALMKYYGLVSLLAGPFFFVPLIPLFARYRSLRYRIDDEGISMRWGILFQREVSLNYARIQDIHLSSNVVERWLGLGKIQVQTASGSAKAEMTLEGVPDLHAMRDFLYEKMRGARGEQEPGPSAASHPPVGPGDAAGSEALEDTLRAVAAEIRALRVELAGREGHDA
ncbi:MAG: PH domain-containing protein [Longimicrobiales bacterium]